MTSRLRRLCPVLLLSLGLLGAETAAQESVTLTPTKDNTLYEDEAGALSNGAGHFLFIGTTAQGVARRALLAFDVAGNVPAGAQILNVTLTLNMSRTLSGAEPATLHRVTSDWGEGTSDATGEEGAGAPAGAGDATWVHAFFDTLAWQSPGGDFVTDASATDTVGGVGAYTWGSTAELVADVQQWLDDPASNFGWILLGNEAAGSTTKRFDSRERAGSPPALAVSFSAVTAIEGPEQPAVAELFQNHPNPFTRETTLAYSLQTPRHVTLDVYNLLGQRQRRLVDAWQPAGTHRVRFAAGDLPGGVYLYRLDAGGQSRSGRMILVR